MGLGMKICCAFFLGICVVDSQAQVDSKALHKIQLEGPAQGSQFHLIYYAQDTLVRRREIDSILHVIDQSMSVYRKDSKISLFNQDTVLRLKMDSHMAKVIAASFRYHELSNRQFDITIAPLVNLWGFGVKKTGVVPDSAMVDQVRQYVGMKHLTVEGDQLLKKKKGVKIDVNGIAQGYTVDVLAGYLEDKGLTNYMVEVGGEIRVSGTPPGQPGFSIGIIQPDVSGQEDMISAVVQLHEGALTTAGSFEQFITYKGQRMGHHIDPLTGFPYHTNVLSVTVYARSAMEADALDNFFMSMDPENIIDRAKKMEDVEVFVIYKNKNQSIQTIYSDGFGKLFKN